MREREVLARLRALKNARNIRGMARFGIQGKKVLGIPKPRLDGLAKKIGRDQALSLKLWGSGYHEARILAGLVGSAAEVTPAQMERWVGDFDSWDLCDQVCGHLFDRTPFAASKAFQWSRRKREFEKRAGFVLMAGLAVHDKRAPDRLFLSFLPVVRREARDGRNFVKKAVNWALRQIGKRNPRLRRAALAEAARIQQQGSASARWIAADAIRELKNPKTPVRKLPLA
ncbi:MAG TPA: DNA alkylation repair protein [bacterium]|nr:DNA alkylation repair protein [bacterium]